MLILAFIVLIVDLVPMVKKKMGKEAAVLILLGSVTLAYGYYYTTHMYTASLVKLIYGIFNIQ